MTYGDTPESERQPQKDPPHHEREQPVEAISLAAQQKGHRVEPEHREGYNPCEQELQDRPKDRDRIPAELRGPGKGGEQGIDIGEPETRTRQHEIEAEDQHHATDHYGGEIERPPPCHRRALLAHGGHKRDDADGYAADRGWIQTACAG